MADAEGKAGHNPEENLGKGARNLIRFKPIVMKSRRKNLRSTTSKQLHLMMNRGRGRIGQTDFTPGDENESPMGDGLSRAIRARFRKQPNTLRDPRKMGGLDTSATEQKGLKTMSARNFKDRKRKERRQKLDITF